MKRFSYHVFAFLIIFSIFALEARAAAGIVIPNDTGLPSSTVSAILQNLMAWLLGILGFIGIMAFIISGLQYLLAAGDEKTIETAKTNMKYSIIGVIIALSGFIVIQAVNAALTAANSNF